MKKIILICAGAVLLIALLIGFVWWHVPTVFLEDVDPADVARIEVFNGTNGERFAIEDSTDIVYIVEKIGDVKMQREEWEVVDGFVYSLSFYTADGTCIEKFILNDDDTIRDGNMEYETVYETEHDPLCFYYIKDLEDVQRNH